ncbi:MAG TPA: AraC family transcriptional regulator [Ktedonobacteraceae bacterium]|nr:AraC family transcriptional regulator [Ktedonobacteraceae bacterium]
MFQTTIKPTAIYEHSVDMPSHLFNSGSRKADTEVSRHGAIRQAIAMMRSNFQNPLTLQEIASSVQFSSFHFNRIFRSITGIPPSVYLAALRIEEAKKLLLRSNLSVTSICFDVGYNSLGTFTTRFTQFVGATPTQFRQISRDDSLNLFVQQWNDLKTMLTLFQQHQGTRVIEGTIDVPEPFDGLIFIGLFTNPIPQSAPTSCTVLAEPGRYSLPEPPDGKYYLFAAAVQRSESFLALLEATSSLRCTRQQAISVQSGKVPQSIDLTLHAMSWTDAPILIALPWLLISRMTTSVPELVYAQEGGR